MISYLDVYAPQLRFFYSIHVKYKLSMANVTATAVPLCW